MNARYFRPTGGFQQRERNYAYIRCDGRRSSGVLVTKFGDETSGMRDLRGCLYGMRHGTWEELLPDYARTLVSTVDIRVAETLLLKRNALSRSRCGGCGRPTNWVAYCARCNERYTKRINAQAGGEPTKRRPANPRPILWMDTDEPGAGGNRHHRGLNGASLGFYWDDVVRAYEDNGGA